MLDAPDLYNLCQELTSKEPLVARAPIPDRLRMSIAKPLDDPYRAMVFGSKGLAPLYFLRSSSGGSYESAALSRVEQPPSNADHPPEGQADFLQLNYTRPGRERHRPAWV